MDESHELDDEPGPAASADSSRMPSPHSDAAANPSHGGPEVLQAHLETSAAQSVSSSDDHASEVASSADDYECDPAALDLHSTPDEPDANNGELEGAESESHVTDTGIQAERDPASTRADSDEHEGAGEDEEMGNEQDASEEDVDTPPPEESVRQPVWR